MNRCYGAVSLLLAGLACTPGSGQQAIEADRERIGAVIESMARANNAGDVSGWVANFDRDAVYMPAGTPPVTGRADLEETARAGFGSYDAEISIEPVEIIVSGDWAFARARVTGRVTPREGGDPIPIDNKELIVFRRQADGGWKIARLMINSNRS